MDRRSVVSNNRTCECSASGTKQPRSPFLSAFRGAIPRPTGASSHGFLRTVKGGGDERGARVRRGSKGEEGPLPSIFFGPEPQRNLLSSLRRSCRGDGVGKSGVGYASFDNLAEARGWWVPKGPIPQTTRCQPAGRCYDGDGGGWSKGTTTLKGTEDEARAGTAKTQLPRYGAAGRMRSSQACINGEFRIRDCTILELLPFVVPRMVFVLMEI